jgi:hypothetical protein|eukprot:Tamp_35589.p1 GENE.Tamp_35589~~Tamp_35589.p1  ORF type:complete len:134 (+),score=12.52 Tamp_35589:166-567(+)
MEVAEEAEEAVNAWDWEDSSEYKLSSSIRVERPPNAASDDTSDEDDNGNELYDPDYPMGAESVSCRWCGQTPVAASAPAEHASWLEDHLQVCRQAVVPCPCRGYGCQVLLPRWAMAQHLPEHYDYPLVSFRMI